MAYYNQNIKILMQTIMLVVTIISRTHAGDNDTLVNRMCGATYAPNICQSCIKKDQNGAHTDSDVIQVLLRCANDDALLLEQDVNAAIDDTSTDDTTRATLFKINPLIKDFTQAGGTVQHLAMARKFDDSRSTIRDSILANVAKCDALLAAPGVTIPPRVFSGFFKVEADYKISDQLIASVQA